MKMSYFLNMTWGRSLVSLIAMVLDKCFVQKQCRSMWDEIIEEVFFILGIISKKYKWIRSPVFFLYSCIIFHPTKSIPNDMSEFSLEVPHKYIGSRDLIYFHMPHYFLL